MNTRVFQQSLRFDRERNRVRGFSLVEFLVVMLIVIILAVYLGKTFSSALSIDQRFKEQAGVRTCLSHHLAYAERYLSLAAAVDTNHGCSITFRPETAGVSLETGHWIRVSSVSCHTTNDSLAFQIESGDERWDPLQIRLFTPKGFLYNADSRVTNIVLEGSGRVRRIRIEGAYRAGEHWTNIVVCRPVRLWNQWN
jgi:type II secretory pathway pseudopilin PulG